MTDLPLKGLVIAGAEDLRGLLRRKFWSGVLRGAFLVYLAVAAGTSALILGADDDRDLLLAARVGIGWPGFGSRLIVHAWTREPTAQKAEPSDDPDADTDTEDGDPEDDGDDGLGPYRRYADSGCRAAAPG